MLSWVVLFGVFPEAANGGPGGSHPEDRLGLENPLPSSLTWPLVP